MYLISDLNEFSINIRKISFEKFSEANSVANDEFSPCLSKEKQSSEIDDVITVDEVKTIILSNVIKINEEYKFKEKTFIKILEEINSRMVSNILNNLVKKNIVDVAFDENQNDFVFWVKDKDD